MKKAIELRKENLAPLPDPEAERQKRAQADFGTLDFLCNVQELKTGLPKGVLKSSKRDAILTMARDLVTQEAVRIGVAMVHVAEYFGLTPQAAYEALKRCDEKRAIAQLLADCPFPLEDEEEPGEARCLPQQKPNHHDD